MSKYLPLAIILCSTLQWGLAQRQQAWIDAADTAYAQQDYYEAFKYYEAALAYDSTSIELIQKYADAARQFNAYSFSEDGYRRVIQSARADEFPLASYWLALMLQRQGEYQEAIDQYRRFQSSYGENIPGYQAKSEKQIEGCLWALSQQMESAGDTLQHLGPEVNTPYSEFGPFLAGDSLYYSSFRYEYKKDKHNPPRVFIKTLRSVEGTEGAPLTQTGSFNQDSTHTANAVFSADGQRMYFTRCQYVKAGKVRCELFLRRRTADGMGWEAPEKLEINQPGYTNTQPSIGRWMPQEEEVLFFSSDRPGGAGGLDIWYSPLHSDGRPGPPVNLEDINTGMDEVTPFFHTLSQQLFFSSDAYLGMGGLDVYRSQRRDTGWTQPANLGVPVNTSYNEISYFLNPRGTKALFASDRLGSSYIEPDREACCYDIYSQELDIRIDLLARTFNNFDQTALSGATVYLYEVNELGEEVLVDSLTNPLDNNFRFPLERYRKYRIEARRDGFRTASVDLDLTETEFFTSTTIERDLFLDPATIDLQVLTFDAGDRSPLPGTTVQLLEMAGGEPQLVSEQNNETGNNYLFPLEVGKTYILTAQKPGYESLADTVRFTPEDIENLGPRVTVELYLPRISFDDFLPLALYFDNDRPDRRSYSPTTEKTYGETNRAYYEQKQTYIERFMEGLPESEQFVTINRYDNFFDLEVQGGYTDLVSFSEKLLDYLEGGNSIEIILQGYASPRASSSYNLILSRRRISSVKNHFYNFQDGALQRFLDNGQFKIGEEAFGELRANPLVVSQLDDERNSIYNLAAALERRVEIIEVRTGDELQSRLIRPERRP